MHMILLALGIVVTVAGGAMAGFGIANNGFDIGNTLISAGTTAVVGGLIIVNKAIAPYIVGHYGLAGILVFVGAMFALNWWMDRHGYY